jgi:hypothetical protein
MRELFTSDSLALLFVGLHVFLRAGHGKIKKVFQCHISVDYKAPVLLGKSADLL